MTIRISVLATLLAATMLWGCDDSPSSDDRALTITYPFNGSTLDFSMDTDEGMEGLNIDIQLYAEDVNEGQLVTLAAGATSMELEFHTNPMIFHDFNLGSEEGPVTLVASLGDTQSPPVTVEIVNLCPTASIVRPGSGATLDASDDEEPSDPGFQYTLTAATSAPNGDMAILFEDDVAIGDPAVVSGGTATFSAVTLTEGPHQYEVQIQGSADVCEWESIDVTIDTGQPVCTITDPDVDVLNIALDGNAGTPGMEIDVTVTTDASETITVSVEVDGESSGLRTDDTASGSITFDLVPLDDGDRVLQAICTDGAGNMGASSERHIAVDTVAPDINIVRPDEGEAFTLDDDMLDRYDDVQVEVFITSEASDVEGQDVTTAISGGTPLADPFGINTMVDGERLLYVTLPTGDSTVVATLEDEHGNISTATVNVRLDTDAPTVTLLSPTAGTVLNMAADGDATLEDFQGDVVACTDDPCTGVLQADGADIATAVAVPDTAGVCAAPATHVLTFEDVTIPDGSDTTLRVECTDAAGLVGHTGTGTAFMVDTYPPVCDLTAPDEADPPVSASAMPITPNYQLEYETRVTISPGTYDETLSPPYAGAIVPIPEVTLADGDNTFTCSSTDLAGNSYTDSEVITVSTSYRLTITSPRDGDYRDTTTLEVCATTDFVPDGETINIDVGGSTVGTFVTPATCTSVTLTEGAHEIHAWVTVGGGGLPADAEDRIDVTVDTTPPGPITGLDARVRDRRESSLLLDWNAPAGGMLGSFQVRWSHDPITTEPEFDAAHDVAWTGGPTSGGALASMEIGNLTVERDYHVAIRAVDLAGNLGSMVPYGAALHPRLLSTMTEPGGPGAVVGLTASGPGDITGDGSDDMIAGTAGDGFYIYEGPLPGTGAWAPDHTVGSGWSVALGIGDFNGDGHPDVAVGAPNDGGGIGALHIYYGGPTTVWATATPDVTINGVAAGGALGWTVAAAGDFCGTPAGGDGFMDVIVSAPRRTGTSVGDAYVICGEDVAPGMVTDIGAADLTILHIQGTAAATASASFGYRMAGLGDINGDGTDDIAITHKDQGVGHVYVVRGLSVGTIESVGTILTSNATYVQTLIGPAGTDDFGTGLAGVGDVDGDSLADLVVGDPYNDTSAANAGAVHVFLSDGSWLETTPVTLTSAWAGRSNHQLGYAIALNGAGFGGADDRSFSHLPGPDRGLADVIATTNNAQHLTFLFGNAAAFTGSLTSDDLEDDSTTPESSDGLGLSLMAASGIEHQEFASYAGDLNDDGYEDLIVTDIARSGDWSGIIAVYY